ncbi:MAG: hypothetical protein HY741_10015 [Chloroflexi bacterium]|nr:hypothetical protein [Chloroflexota bacterium]
MNSRERIEAIWKRTKPDRVPWTPMLGDSYLRSMPRYYDRLTPEQQQALRTSYKYPSLAPLPSTLGFQEIIIWEMIRDVRGDVLASVATVEVVDEQVQIRAQVGRDKETAFVFQTPWGELREVVAGSGSAETVYRVRFAIAERREYEIMTRVLQHRRYRPRYERYAEKQMALGDKGACVVAGPDQPLVSLFRVRDPAELIFDLADEPDRMKALLDLLHARASEAYRLIAKGPGRAVLTGMAFMTTQLISPRIFEKYVMPYLAEYVQTLHAEDKILICHMCGHIRRLLPMLREAGIDGIESLTSPPIGDTALETFWRELGARAILIGGVDVNLLLRGTPDQLRAHVHDVLKRTVGYPHILSSADEVPFGTPTENLLAVAEAAREFSD